MLKKTLEDREVLLRLKNGSLHMISSQLWSLPKLWKEVSDWDGLTATSAEDWFWYNLKRKACITLPILFDSKYNVKYSFIVEMVHTFIDLRFR